MLVQAARHCPQHVLVSLWRRKSLLLGCVMVMSVFVVCLQFSSNGNNGHLVANGLPDSRNREEIPLGMVGVGGSHKTLIPRRNLSALNQRQDQNSIGVGIVKPGQLVDMSGKPPRYQQPQSGGDPRAINYVGSPENNRIQVYGDGKAVPNNNPNNNWQDQQQSKAWQNNGNSVNNYYIPALRVVHFDMKGAPPKVSYFKQIFPVLPSQNP